MRFFVISLLLSAVRINGNISVAKFLSPPLIGSTEDETTVAANLKAIFYPVGRRIFGISSQKIDFDDVVKIDWEEGRYDHGKYEHDNDKSAKQ